jgi:hypothetical protein
MTCRLYVSISVNNLNDVLNKCVNEKTEYSGTLHFGDSISKHTKEYKSREIRNVQSGQQSSVSTVNALYNYHVHPRICYTKGGCIYGWLSGEDIRSCLEMALLGNRGHLVFALEGVYTLSIKSSFLDLFNNPDNIKPAHQQAVFDVIQDYFRSAHEYRTGEYLKTFDREAYRELPHVMVNIVNSCTLHRLVGNTTFKTSNKSFMKRDVINESKMKDDIAKKCKKSLDEVAGKLNNTLLTALIFNCQFVPSNFFIERDANGDNVFSRLQLPPENAKILISKDVEFKEEYPKEYIGSKGEDNCTLTYLESKLNKKEFGTVHKGRRRTHKLKCKKDRR